MKKTLIFITCIYLCIIHGLLAEINRVTIEKLNDRFIQAAEEQTTSEIRRACKRVIRQAEKIVKENAESPERFEILDIIFKAQQLLYMQSQNEENTRAVYETAKILSKAPDQYAIQRLGADLILLQIQMGEIEDENDKAMLIAQMADRYRNTNAEAKSLIVACNLSFNVGHNGLLSMFKYILSQRYSSDHEVSAFLKERFASRKPISFIGVFKKPDGSKMSFPKGHKHVICFWSREVDDLDAKIAEIVKFQERYKGVRVFSFNLDELKDGGASILKQKKLDWEPLLLKDGENNSLFGTLGTGDLFACLVVNAHGYAPFWRAQGGGHNKAGKSVIDLHSRYESATEDVNLTNKWRSLLIGDFLCHGMGFPTKSTIPIKIQKAIKSHFIPTHSRDQVSVEDEVKHYEAVIKLSTEAEQLFEKSPDLWIIKAYKIIALMGVWRNTGAWNQLEQALELSRDLINETNSSKANLIAHYCRSMHAMQKEGASHNQILSSFKKNMSSFELTPEVCIAGLLLSLEGHMPNLYAEYRNKLIEHFSDKANADWFTAFFLSEGLSKRLFMPALPDMGKTVPTSPKFGRVFVEEFKAISGNAHNLSKVDDSKIRICVFMERAINADALKNESAVIETLSKLLAKRSVGDVECNVFYPEEHGEFLIKKIKLDKNKTNFIPLNQKHWAESCKKYGILSPNKMPNILLLRPGSVITGVLNYLNCLSNRQRHISSGSLIRLIEPKLRELELPLIEEAFALKNYKLAAKRLESSPPLAYRKKSRYEPNWLAENKHLRKLIWCYIKMGALEKALKSSEKLIKDRFTHSSYAKGQIKAHKWCRSCHGHLDKICVEMILLEELGEHEEAKKIRSIFTPRACSEINDINVLWQYVKSNLNHFKKKKPYRYKNAKYYLKSIRSEMGNKQDLSSFGIESDYLTHALILEKMGQSEKAKQFKNNAKLHAWPYEPRVYDPDRTAQSTLKRKRQAKMCIDNEQWQKAYDLLTINLKQHEEGPKRCEVMCQICGEQQQALELHAKALKSTSRIKEAQISKTMAKAVNCPFGYGFKAARWYFPAGRVGWGNVNKSHLGYIEEYLRGGVHAREERRKVRFSLSSDLLMRARALEALGNKEAAQKDRSRAKALTYLSGLSWERPRQGAVKAMTIPERYVDLFGTTEEK